MTTTIPPRPLSVPLTLFFFLFLFSLAGWSAFPAQMQRPRWHEQLWRLRGGSLANIEHWKVRQGVCRLLERATATAPTAFCAHKHRHTFSFSFSSPATHTRFDNLSHPNRNTLEVEAFFDFHWSTWASRIYTTMIARLYHQQLPTN